VRLSSDQNAVQTPTGEAPDGEVEDYILIVEQNPYTNPINPFDVTGDGFVSPIDVLQVINFINTSGGGSVGLTLPRDPELPLLDVNGDGAVNSLDVSGIITYINSRLPGGSFGGEGEGEGEGVSDLGNLWVAAPAPSVNTDGQKSGNSSSSSDATCSLVTRAAHSSLDDFLASLGSQEMGPLPADDSIDVISHATAEHQDEDGKADWAVALEDVLQDMF
jgi:hypothetical protein